MQTMHTLAVSPSGWVWYSPKWTERWTADTHTALFILYWVSTEADVFTHLLCIASEHRPKFSQWYRLNRQLFSIGADVYICTNNYYRLINEFKSQLPILSPRWEIWIMTEVILRLWHSCVKSATYCPSLKLTADKTYVSFLLLCDGCWYFMTYRKRSDTHKQCMRRREDCSERGNTWIGL